MSEAEILALVNGELLKIAGGASVVLCGLSAFVGRIWINRIANNERSEREAEIATLRANLERTNEDVIARLDAALQRTIHVDKLQFEHEYEVYRGVWKTLFSLREATMKLRPALDSVPTEESEEERVQRRIDEFRGPYNSFVEAVEENRPFYDDGVYSSLRNVLKLCRTEVINYQYKERSWSEYWKEAEASREAILGAIEAVCSAIRSRIASIRVV